MTNKKPIDDVRIDLSSVIKAGIPALEQNQALNVIKGGNKQGRYCLNDLHRAAGGEKRHQPSDWLRTDQAKSLILEVDKAVPGNTGTKQNQSLTAYIMR